MRNTLAAYLNKLLGYGVSGFRVDAAKHIGQPDLAAIERWLHRTVDGTRPYLALEVPPAAPASSRPGRSAASATCSGFDFATQIHDAFKSYTTAARRQHHRPLGLRRGLRPAAEPKSLVLRREPRHRAQRLDAQLQGRRAQHLATEFMLACAATGAPRSTRASRSRTRDDSPPADADGFVTDTDCANGWVCTDRFTGVRNMVGWHNYAGERAGRQLVRRRRQPDRVQPRVTAGSSASTTRTPPRRSPCDRPAAGHVLRPHPRRPHAHGACSGPTVTVAGNGKATITVRAYDSVDLYGTGSPR